jgi:hypothetical protein
VRNPLSYVELVKLVIVGTMLEEPVDELTNFSDGALLVNIF